MKENLGVPTRSNVRDLKDDRSLTVLEEALVSFEEALKIRPDYAEAWYGKGVTLAELGRLEEALACFEESVKIKPDYAKAWVSKAVTLRRLTASDQKPKRGPQNTSSSAEKTSIGQDAASSSHQRSLTSSKDYLSILTNLERQENSDTKRQERSPRANHSMDALDSNPFKLLADGESLVVDCSNLIRQRCEPHNGKPCNNPARLWILFQLLSQKKEWEGTATTGAICLIIIDASLRHHVNDQAALDDLSNTQAVIQMPPGHPSDSLILKEADELGAVVLTNDAKMKEQYAAQYSWLRDSHRFINSVVISDNAKKIEYVRNTWLPTQAGPKHKPQEHRLVSDARIVSQPSPSKLQAAPHALASKPESHGWLLWLRRKTNHKENKSEDRQAHCPKCGASVDISNPRIRFCYRCRAQISPVIHE